MLGAPRAMRVEPWEIGLSVGRHLLLVIRLAKRAIRLGFRFRVVEAWRASKRAAVLGSNKVVVAFIAFVLLLGIKKF